MNGDFESHRQSFLESLKVRRYSPRTVAAYGKAVELFGRFAAERGIGEVREVTAATVRAYQLHLIECDRTPWTRCAYAQGLRRFFEHLEKTDVVLVNPCAGLVLPKVENRLPRRVLTREEACKLLAAPDVSTAKGLRDKAILELFYSTGIRLEEMTQLTVQDVDCRSQLVRVEKGKFAKGRMVPMGEIAAESLQQYLTRVRAAWVRTGEKELKTERALWLGSIQPHGPLKALRIQVMVREYALAVGIGQVSPHIWRHTCAAHLVSSGANLAYVQRILGHESLETTQIYARVTLDEIKEGYSKAHPRSRSRKGNA